MDTQGTDTGPADTGAGEEAHVVLNLGEDWFKVPVGVVGRYRVDPTALPEEPPVGASDDEVVGFAFRAGLVPSTDAVRQGSVFFPVGDLGLAGHGGLTPGDAALQIPDGEFVSGDPLGGGRNGGVRSP